MTEPQCTCDPDKVLTVCHDMRNEPHFVGCPRWGTPKRCPSLYGPEQIQCTKRADEPHEWHAGSGTYPADDPDSPGEVYGAAWLSHWEPGLTDREVTR